MLSIGSDSLVSIGPLPSIGWPSGLTTRPSIASPTGTSTTLPVRFAKSPSLTNLESPKRTKPTLSSSKFKARDYNVILNESEFWNHLDFSTATTISKNITDHFLNKKVDQIRVIFNEFVNVATQKVIVKTLLPLEFEEDLELSENTDLLYEPSKEEIIDHLTPKHVKVQVWRFLLESFASEQAARMVAMENATSNSEEMIKDLTLKFNKARQAAITTEMLEIVGGAEALKG